jgi:hypothetical protein
MVRINKLKNSEKGVAIVFALGIVALLLVIALGFVITSIVEKQTGKNFSDLKIARLAAQSGLQRVIAGMKYYSNNYSFIYFNSLVSHDPAADSDLVYYEDLPTLMANVEDGEGREVFDWNTYYPSDFYDPTDSDHITWQYLPQNNGVDTPIIARFAYLVISDKGKIDPSASVDSGVNADINSVSAISENYPVSEATSVSTDGGDVIGRPGRDISELFLTTLPSWFTDNMAEKISVTNADSAGQLTIGERWLDFDTLFNSLNITDDATKDSFYNVFCLDNPKNLEAFWIDANSDDICNSEEMYHRFNLTRTDWGEDFAVDSIKQSPVAFIETYSENNVTSIPWLKNWKSAGGMGSAENCKNQIIANLIDYNDSDNAATTDEDIATSAQNFNPTYVGVDNCPYINEVKLIFRVHIDRRGLVGPGNDKRRQYRFRLRLQRVTVEVVNMYGVDEDDNGVDPADRKRAQVYVDYNFKFYVDYNYLRGRWRTDASSGIEQIWGNQITKNLTFTDAESHVDGKNDRNVRTYAYDFSNSFDAWSAYYDTANDLGGPGTTYPITINDILAYAQINSLKVKYYNRETQSKLYDFSFLESNADSMPILEEDYVLGNDVRMNLVVDYEINDPRQNLLTTDWGLSTDVTTNYTAATATGTTAYSTINAKNSNCDLPISDDVSHADSDPELGASEPWNVSTAYIRNAPMLSPWELGFIHRGAAWQTINLKKYNSTKGVTVTGGGNAYSDGDANILEQIKMTSDTETYGNICINTDIKEVLTVLFQKINVGSDIKTTNDPGTLSGTKVDATDAGLLADEVLDNNKTDGGSLFRTRAQALRNTNGLTDALCYDVADGGIVTLGRTTDATQEEIIGKFINLTTADFSNVFKVIVVAQAVKDTGGGITIKKMVDKVERTVPNVQIGTYDQYADEILATQKILATVQRDPATDKFYIVKFEYIE